MNLEIVWTTRFKKDYKLAIENYTKAIELNPEYHFYYIKRATAYKAMNQIDKYKEDKKKFEETVRVQKEDKINNTKLNNGILKPKKDNKNKIIFIIKLLILLSAFFAIVYFHPTKEVLNCNSRQVCKVEQTYFGLFKINKKIKLYPNSNLYCKIGAYSASKHNTYYGLYIRIDDIAPFVFYVADSVYSSYDYQIEDLEEKCNFYQQNFIKYMENYGKYQYVLDSKADTSKMLLSLIFVMLIAYVIFCSEITQLSEEIRQKKFDKKKI